MLLRHDINETNAMKKHILICKKDPDNLKIKLPCFFKMEDNNDGGKCYSKALEV